MYSFQFFTEGTPSGITIGAVAHGAVIAPVALAAAAPADVSNASRPWNPAN